MTCCQQSLPTRTRSCWLTASRAALNSPSSPTAKPSPSPNSSLTSRLEESAGEAAVGYAMWAGRLRAEPGDLVGLVVGEVALVPEPLGLVFVVALPGQDVGRDPIKEPAVM